MPAARRRGGRRGACSAAPIAGGGPARVRASTREPRAGRPLRRACAGERTDGGAFAARRAAPPAPGACSRPPSTCSSRAAEARPARPGARRVLIASRRPARGAWPRSRARGGASSARGWSSRSPARPEDLDQGHPRRAARAGARDGRHAASNHNTEIGLPLAILAAPRGTPRCWCWRWRCAAPGQIAELTAIAEPDVGVIVNVGPAHLELLGTLEAIAAAKAELIAGLARGATAVVPAGEPPARAAPAPRTCRRSPSAPGGDVRCDREAGARWRSSLIGSGGTRVELEPGFAPAHLLHDLLRGRGGRARARRQRSRAAALRGRASRRCAAALAAARRRCSHRRLLQRQPDVDARRARRPLPRPPAEPARVAVLGDMLELGEQRDERRFTARSASRRGGRRRRCWSPSAERAA